VNRAGLEPAILCLKGPPLALITCNSHDFDLGAAARSGKNQREPQPPRNQDRHRQAPTSCSAPRPAKVPFTPSRPRFQSMDSADSTEISGREFISDIRPTESCRFFFAVFGRCGIDAACLRANLRFQREYRHQAADLSTYGRSGCPSECGGKRRPHIGTGAHNCCGVRMVDCSAVPPNAFSTFVDLPYKEFIQTGRAGAGE
jgi:hypothetical protein